MVDQRFIYREVAIGGVKKRNRVLRDEEIKNEVKRCGKECYYSWLLFTEELQKYVEQNQSVSGYHGIVKAPFLPFDIDAEDENLGQALRTARQLVTGLHFDFDCQFEALRYYFSGSRGFHVLIPASLFAPDESEELPLVLRKMAIEVSEKAGVDTDLKIYNIVHLLRIPNTRHKDSGLFKVPLSWDEFKEGSVDEILARAKKPREMRWPKIRGENLKLRELYLQSVTEVRSKASFYEGVGQTTEAEVPVDKKRCYYQMLKGVPEGIRDECGIRLACYLRAEGFSSDIVTAMLLAWNKRNSPPLQDERIERKVMQAFSHHYYYGCQDLVLSKFCEGKCALAKKIYEEPKPLSEWGRDYMNYIDSLASRKVHLGLGRIDHAMRGLAPGETAEVIALPSVGKSVLALNILGYVSNKQSIPSLFFSLEQPGVQVFERASTLSVDLQGRDIEDGLRDGTISLDSLLDSVREEFREVFLCDATGVTLKDIGEMVRKTTRKWGKTIRFIVIDYLGLIGGAYGTSYEVITRISRDIKRLAKELNIAVLFLHHVSVKQKKIDEPLSLGDARDSSVAVDAVDFLLGMWRPDEREVEISLLKNRKGPKNIRQSFTFDLETLSIKPKGNTDAQKQP